MEAEKCEFTFSCNVFVAVSSLRSRRLEVVGARKNERARGSHARGEGAPAGLPEDQ